MNRITGSENISEHSTVHPNRPPNERRSSNTIDQRLSQVQATSNSYTAIETSNATSLLRPNGELLQGNSISFISRTTDSSEIVYNSLDLSIGRSLRSDLMSTHPTSFDQANILHSILDELNNLIERFPAKEKILPELERYFIKEIASQPGSRTSLNDKKLLKNFVSTHFNRAILHAVKSLDDLPHRTISLIARKAIHPYIKTIDSRKFYWTKFDDFVDKITYSNDDGTLLRLLEGEQAFTYELVSFTLHSEISFTPTYDNPDIKSHVIKDMLSDLSEQNIKKLSNLLMSHNDLEKEFNYHLSVRLINKFNKHLDSSFTEALAKLIAVTWKTSSDNITNSIELLLCKAGLHFVTKKYGIDLTVKQEKKAAIGLQKNINCTKEGFFEILNNKELLENFLFMILDIDGSIENQKEKLRNKIVDLHLGLTPRRVNDAVERLVERYNNSIWQLDRLNRAAPSRIQSHINQMLIGGQLGNTNRNTISIVMPKLPPRRDKKLGESDASYAFKNISSVLTKNPNAKIEIKYPLQGLTDQRRGQFTVDMGGPTKEAFTAAISHMADLENAVTTNSGVIDLNTNPYKGLSRYHKINEEAKNMGLLIGKAMELHVEGISHSYIQRVSDRLIRCVDSFRFGSRHSLFQKNGLCADLYKSGLQGEKVGLLTKELKEFNNNQLLELLILLDLFPDLKDGIFSNQNMVDPTMVHPAIEHYFTKNEVGRCFRDDDETPSVAMMNLMLEKATPICHFIDGFYDITKSLGKIGDPIFLDDSDLSFSTALNKMFGGATLYDILTEEKYLNEMDKITVRVDDCLKTHRKDDISELTEKAKRIFIRFAKEHASEDGCKALSEHITASESFDPISGIVLELKANGAPFFGHTCFNTLDIVVSSIEGDNDEMILEQWKSNFGSILSQPKQFSDL